MIRAIWRWLRAPLPRVGSLWTSRATGSRYEVCAVDEGRRRIWGRLYAGGIVKQPRDCFGAREFHACFAPYSLIGCVDRLLVRPDDTLVLTLPLDIDEQGEQQLVREVRGLFPGHTFVVLPAGGTLSAVGSSGRHTIGSVGAAPAPVL